MQEKGHVWLAVSSLMSASTDQSEIALTHNTVLHILPALGLGGFGTCARLSLLAVWSQDWGLLSEYCGSRL